MKQKIIFLMGPTCAGKSSVIESLPESVGRIEVGKELRKRHPPDYFQGSAAPRHTETEAWELFVSRFKEQYGIGVIVVDGQPRTPSQVFKISNFLIQSMELDSRFVLLDVPDNDRLERLSKRFPVDSPEYRLSHQRMMGDKIVLYDVIVELIKCGHSIEVVKGSNCISVDDVREIIFGDKI